MVLRNPNCTLCPLYQDARYVCLIGDGDRDAEIMLVGEAPGKTEEFTRKPFSGNAGELLDSVLYAHGLDREDIYITNVVKCRPQDAKGENKAPSPKQIDICTRAYLTREIRKVKPKLIIAMGKSAIYGILGKKITIAEARNVVFRTGQPYIKNIPVLCTFHPAAALYTDSISSRILEDFKYALKILREGEPQKIDLDYRQCANLSDHHQNMSPVAIDLEWNARDFFHSKFKIFSAQTSSKEGSARFHLWDGEPVNNLGDSLCVERIRCMMLDRKVEIVNHFLKHDLKALSRYGIVARGPIFSTEVALHLLDENLPDRGLDAVCAAFTSLKGHKQSLQQYMRKHKVRIHQVPLPVLIPYGCGDADGALRLRNYAEPRLKEQGLWPLFSKLLMPSMKMYVEMECNGAHIDRGLLRSLIKEYKQRIGNTRKLCFHSCGSIFNLNSWQQLHNILYKRWKLPPLGTPKKWNDPPSYDTRETTIKKLAKLDNINERQRRFLTSLLELRKLNKTYGTYLLGIKKRLRAGNLIHCDWNFTGTETLRTSCRNINLQNVTRKSDIKSLFTSRFGHRGRIASLDLSQAELRWIADLAQDRKLLSYFRNRVDVHVATAAELFDISIGDITESQRFIAKTINFGICYGMTEYLLSKQLGPDGKEIFRSVNQAKRFLDRYHSTYPRVKILMDKIHKEILETGQVRNLFGGIRHITILDSSTKHAKKALREGGNAPIQGAVSLYNRYCGLLAWRRIKKEGIKPVVWWNEVHDAWLLDTLEENIPIIYPILQECFTKPDLSPFGFELTVPMEIEFSYGRNWKDLKPYTQG